MNFSLFWDADSRLCAVVAQGGATADLALAATDAAGRQDVIATCAGESVAGLRLLIGQLPSAATECVVVDLDRPQILRARFVLGSMGGEEASVWRCLAFGARENGGRLHFEIVRPDVSATDYGPQDLRDFVPHYLADNALSQMESWLVAARVAMSGEPRTKPALLVWPSEPALAVRPPSRRATARFTLPDPEAWPALYRLAYEASWVEPTLEFFTREPQLVARSGPMALVVFSHQIRFLRAKDSFLDKAGLPDTNPTAALEDIEDPDAEAEAVKRFDWRADAKVTAGGSRPVYLDISSDGASARLKYSDGAIGDDVFLIAASALLTAPPVVERAERAIGFRVGERGFEPLELGARDVKPYVEIVKRMAHMLRETEGFRDRDPHRRQRGPTPSQPLGGLMKLAFDEAAKRGVAGDYAHFERAPAALREALTWGRSADFEAVVETAGFAAVLARAASIAIELPEDAPLARQCALVLALRDGQTVERLRAARIRLPSERGEIARALKAAETLCDAERMKSAHTAATQRRNLAPLAAAMRAFGERGEADWTDATDAEALANDIDELFRPLGQGPDVEPSGSNGPEPEVSVEKATEAFKRRLQDARQTYDLDKVQLEELIRTFAQLEADGQLDTVIILPWLEQWLKKLTEGPQIEANFQRAIEAVENWAQLAGFSAALTRGRQGPADAGEWTQIVTRLRTPPLGGELDSGWRRARQNFLATLAARWAEMNRDLRGDELSRRNELFAPFADAMLHHRVYTHLRNCARKRNGAAEKPATAAQLANALRAWPLEAGGAWRAAVDLYGDDDLRPLVEPPALREGRAD